MMSQKIITVIGLPYLTACGILYHFAYWDSFNINGLSLISLNDIIKSFIHPFLYFFIIISISVGINEIIFTPTKIFPHGGGRDSNIGKKLNSKWGLAISISIWICVIYFLYNYGNVQRWYIWAIAFGTVPFLLLDRLGFWSNEFKNNKYRLHAIRLLVFLPTISFASGKYQSEMILKNIHYQYAFTYNIIPNSLDSKIRKIKLLGSTEQYFVFSNLNNENIIFLRSDKINSIILNHE